MSAGPWSLVDKAKWSVWRSVCALAISETCTPILQTLPMTPSSLFSIFLSLFLPTAAGPPGDPSIGCNQNGLLYCTAESANRSQLARAAGAEDAAQPYWRGSGWRHWPRWSPRGQLGESAGLPDDWRMTWGRQTGDSPGQRFDTFKEIVHSFLELIMSVWSNMIKTRHKTNEQPIIFGGTVNVEMFVLYIFSRYSCFWNIRQNMYIVKITFTMLYIDNYIKNANTNPREIVNFRENLYTRKYLRSQYLVVFEVGLFCNELLT